ncbi:MAG: hypothetical protein H6571_07220 [Lewinellaceae bacterium]|nr:hypothetical protein [Lewinellaceae bacterium]
MREIFAVLALLTFTTFGWAQSPQRMSYQAVIRDSNNSLVTNTAVGVQISIIQGSVLGPVVYIETHTQNTNANGLVSLEIGGGDGFDLIDWANGPYFIKTETDPTGGNNYTISGTSQLMSVPYALYAENSGTPGPQGLPGTDGQDGLSAYQIWLNSGNTGTELDFLESLTGPQGLTGPAGNSPIINFGLGSESLIANNSVLNYTLIPGLTTIITVPQGSTHKVLIQTEGGIQLNDSDNTAVGFVDVAIFINNVQEGTGRRVPVQNSPSVIFSVNAYNFSVIKILTEGTYIIEVKAKKFSYMFDDCYVSSSSNGSTLVGNPPLQGTLYVMQFP